MMYYWQMKKIYNPLFIGTALMLIGLFTAYQTHTQSGDIAIEDVRFETQSGKMVSALL